MTECAAADVRVWKRNTTSKWYQGIFVAKLIGVHIVLTVIIELLW